MTGKDRNHDEHDQLARLYREQGNAEPGPGVDQRIRAKARAEVRSSSTPRPAHWLSGVAVAASLFVVVSIVTHIEPPEAELPVSEPARTSADAGARPRQAPEPPAPAPRAPRTRDRRAEASELTAPREDAARSADFASALAGDAERRAERERPQSRAALNQSAPVPDTDTMLQRRTRWAAGDEAAQAAGEHYESLGASRQAEQGEVASRELRPATEQAMGLLAQETVRAQRALWLIERLISVGNAERARAELDAFRSRYPEQAIPQDLIEKLDRLEIGASPD